jgi:hypothetical protein
MTFIALTCDNCGQYGDIICDNCKKRGLREFCYCNKCIEEHLEGDEEERVTQQEMEADKQARREQKGLSMDIDTAHKRAARVVSTMLQLSIEDGAIDRMLAQFWTPEEAQAVKREVAAIAEHLGYEAEGEVKPT